MPTPVTCVACGERTYAASEDRSVPCPRCNANVHVPGAFVEAEWVAEKKEKSYRRSRVMPQHDSDRDSLKVALVVSAIANIVVGLAWGSLCFGLVLGGPMIVLSVFEFLLWQKADDLPNGRLAEKARTMAIFEIVLGIFNTPTLVCGILILIYSGRLSAKND